MDKYELEEAVFALIDEHSSDLSNDDYRQFLQNIIFECNSRMDAIEDDFEEDEE
jgi:hypothetical protein